MDWDCWVVTYSMNMSTIGIILPKMFYEIRAMGKRKDLSLCKPLIS